MALLRPFPVGITARASFSMRKPQQSYFNSERGKCTSIARRGPHDADQMIAGNYPESVRMGRRRRTDETESPKDLRHFGLHAPTGTDVGASLIQTSNSDT